MADLMQQARELAKACEERAHWGRGSGWNLPRDSARTSRLLDEVASLLRELDALRAAPEGYVLVPVKPTPEMLAAVGNGADGLKHRIWRGMVAARPQGVKDA